MYFENVCHMYVYNIFKVITYILTDLCVSVNMLVSITQYWNGRKGILDIGLSINMTSFANKTLLLWNVDNNSADVLKPLNNICLYFIYQCAKQILLIFWICKIQGHDPVVTMVTGSYHDSLLLIVVTMTLVTVTVIKSVVQDVTRLTHV